MTTSSEDCLKLAREAFNSSTSFFDSSIRAQVEAAIRQFQGVHPKNSKYHSELYKSRSRFFRPKTRTAIRKNEATAAEAFFSTKDVMTVSTDNDDDPKSRAGAGVLQSLMQYRLKKTIPWFMLAMGAYQDAQTVGVCISKQYWEYDRDKKVDKPCIELLPIENVRIDPGASWLDPVNSSPYFIRMIPMYVKDVKARMTATDPKTNAPKWKTVADGDILAAVNMAGDPTRMTRERGRQDSTSQSQAITNFSIVWVHENFMEVDGAEQVWYTLGTHAMLTDPTPIDKVYFHGKRPYVIGICVIETHKTYPDGLAGISKDVQAEINDKANQTSDAARFALNKRFLVKRSKQVDLRSLTRNVPGSVTMLESMDDVKVLETGEINHSAYEEQDRLNLDFDDVTGAFSQSSVNSNRKLNETVGGMKILTTDSNLMAGYQLRVFTETWVEPVLRQLMLLEQHYETDKVVLARASKEANLAQWNLGETTIDEILMQDVTLDVNVGIGSTNPQDQVANFLKAMGALRDILADGLLERYGLDVAEVIKELFGKLGYKDGERFFDTEEEDPRLTNAKAMIQQLQQQLAQKVSPEMVAKQVAKLDAEITALGAKARDTDASALEKRMRAFFASGQSSEMLAAVPQLAPLMDALMEAAGYVPPVPAGQDPGLAAPGSAAPGITINKIKDPRTGMQFMPGAAGDTSPQTPATPLSPEVGSEGGINTLRSPT